MVMKRTIVWAIYNDLEDAYAWDEDIGKHLWRPYALGAGPQYIALPTQLRHAVYDPHRPNFDTRPPAAGTTLWL